MIPDFIDPNQPVEQRRAAFLDEAVEFYKNNPRGKDDNGVSTYEYKGRRCIIGRWLELDSGDLENNSNVYSLHYKYEKDDYSPHYKYEKMPEKAPESPFPNWLSKLGRLFLVKAQEFHDSDCFWETNASSQNVLTAYGEEHLSKIKLQFCTSLAEKQLAAV